tara:strand:- start:1 stop:1041 length:1041 start_codon:yes stop_codon:yes gene_type:complete
MHQWRLAALFMISGMGTAFAFKSRTWKIFLRERCQRLLIPMFFGAWTMGFIGSVILGYESSDPVSLTKSFILGIFWRSLIFWIPVFGKLIALGHLWFLWNLFQYSLLMTPIFHYVRKYPDGELIRIFRSFFTMPLNFGILFILPFILTTTEILFKPWFPGYIGVGYEWFWFFVFFAFGYICIIAKEQYFDYIESERISISAITLLFTIAFFWIRIQQHESGIPYVDGGWLENNIFHNKMTIIACFIHSFHAWFWCLTIFSWGSKFLNKPSKNLSYLNQGVYPFYIVHMPLTYAGLRISSDLGIKNYPAVLLSTIIVFITCWLFFELVRRTKISRFLFGIKERKLEN